MKLFLLCVLVSLRAFREKNFVPLRLRVFVSKKCCKHFNLVAYSLYLNPFASLLLCELCMKKLPAFAPSCPRVKKMLQAFQLSGLFFVFKSLCVLAPLRALREKKLRAFASSCQKNAASIST